ncbi:diphthamide biosynthesis protein [Macrolepiota fuliginosa MF-IS2]|uniref:2-(3-amino-3-carboxypropyl)histidine synthase subunit 2 n=1 Tax=Macrolepiota fuliginosa MF-IS2 TaxID=1400762 RepID=A0A9P5X6K3_9AGAR|nr:diphthamide biosynthesis protein [Macrolepiota fuliginosa MF-IS2]
MSAEASAFSTADENAITRTIDIRPDTTADQLSVEAFDDFYDIQRTADEIIQGDYKRIALQFPDELLHDSVPIFRRLKSKIGPGRELYVLADTSYGSCCVDEVAAQHANADAMVHYGHACMSLTSRLPVIYVFGKKKLDIEQCVSRLVEAYKSHTPDCPPKIAAFRYEVAYSHLEEVILPRLQAAFEPLNVTIQYTKLKTKSAPADTNNQPPPIDYSLVLYLGGESLSLTNLLMTHAFCDVLSFDPSTGTSKIESSKTNKMLMRRYAIVQKARDADVFGILVGTLGVSSYLPLITYLRKLLSSHQKKSYTISVGKLTPSKLANFLEIECFVLVACPENSLIEAKEFFKPIVTPFELEVALKKDVSWTGRYVLDFDRVIEEGKVNGEKDDSTDEGQEGEEKDSDQPQFSLITGKYRHAKQYGGEPTDQQSTPTSASDSLVLRNQDTALSKLDDSAAAQFLQQRMYKGLEVRLGEDAPSVLEQGRSGIARGYQTDHGSSDNTQ